MLSYFVFIIVMYCSDEEFLGSAFSSLLWPWDDLIDSYFQPTKFNLKKLNKKTYVIESSDEETAPIEIDPEDLKPENIAEPAPETDDLGRLELRLI